MKFKGIGDWSDLRLDGFLAWVHRLVMLITFPIRRFWQIVLFIVAVVILCLIVHRYYGVGFDGVSRWYHSLRSSAELNFEKKKYTLHDISEKVEQIKNSVSEAVVNNMKDAAKSKKKAEAQHKHFAVWNVPHFKRVSYSDETKNKDVAVDVRSPAEIEKETAKARKTKLVPIKEENIITMPVFYSAKSKEEPLVEKPQTIEKIEAVTGANFYSGALSDYYEFAANRGLLYLQMPEILYGAAEVAGPNSLFIDGKFMFLYGIYSDPREHNLAAARAYLEDVASKESLWCEVVAYAVQTQSATALCFVKGNFINKSMVLNGLARNVSLK